MDLEKLEKFDFSALGRRNSKARLCNLLRVSSRTIYQYCDIAMLIKDFEFDYPSIVKGSKAFTGAKLTKYQCWVIFKLMVVCCDITRASVQDALLTDENPGFTQQFSKQEYLKCQTEMNEGAEDDIYQIVCTAA